MTRQDETALVRAWVAWRTNRVERDAAYIDFFDEEIRNNPRFSGVHVFEALDVLVNSVDLDRYESA